VGAGKKEWSSGIERRKKPPTAAYIFKEKKVDSKKRWGKKGTLIGQQWQWMGKTKLKERREKKKNHVLPLN